MEAHAEGNTSKERNDQIHTYIYKSTHNTKLSQAHHKPAAIILQPFPPLVRLNFYMVRAIVLRRACVSAECVPVKRCLVGMYVYAYLCVRWLCVCFTRSAPQSPVPGLFVLWTDGQIGGRLPILVPRLHLNHVFAHSFSRVFRGAFPSYVIWVAAVSTYRPAYFEDLSIILSRCCTVFIGGTTRNCKHTTTCNFIAVAQFSYDFISATSSSNLPFFFCISHTDSAALQKQ